MTVRRHSHYQFMSFYKKKDSLMDRLNVLRHVWLPEGISGQWRELFGDPYRSSAFWCFQNISVYCFGSKFENCTGRYENIILNGVLEEDTCVTSHRGIGTVHKDSKLTNAIYGPEQAHLMWHKRRCNDLAKLEFRELESTFCVFRRAGISGAYIFQLVYVDEIIIFGTSSENSKIPVNALSRMYEVRHIDSLEWFLGAKI